MGADDLDINRAVRRILVKHWIDLGRLSVRSVNGDVVLYGRLQRLSGAQAPLTPKILEGMFYEMRRIRGVRRVRPHFENWTNADGVWHETDSAVKPGDAATPSSGDRPGPSPGASSAPPWQEAGQPNDQGGNIR